MKQEVVRMDQDVLRAALLVVRTVMIQQIMAVIIQAVHPTEAAIAGVLHRIAAAAAPEVEAVVAEAAAAVGAAGISQH
jgi:hypothetical protein